MTDSLLGLYEKFSANSSVKLSYSQFCRLRPPHVKKPVVSGRDTCACQRCENFKMIVLACHKAEIIYEKNARELVNSRCCSEKTEACLGRECDDCSHKGIAYKLFNPQDEMEYYQWKREKVPVKSNPKKMLEKVHSVPLL